MQISVPFVQELKDIQSTASAVSLTSFLSTLTGGFLFFLFFSFGKSNQGVSLSAALQTPALPRIWADF